MNFLTWKVKSQRSAAETALQEGPLEVLTHGEGHIGVSVLAATVREVVGKAAREGDRCG